MKLFHGDWVDYVWMHDVCSWISKISEFWIDGAYAIAYSAGGGYSMK